MYSFFKGQIIEVTSNNITIDVNNIGYEIKVPNPFYYQENSEVKIYTYLHVREDVLDLYGFVTNEEKLFFKSLLSVKGIGPKSALAILASGNASDIASAIEDGNDKYLTKFPGIGPKAAKQIVLDLKGKLEINDNVVVNDYNDVIEALVALGYKKKEIDKHVKNLDSGLSDSDAIKVILQKM